LKRFEQALAIPAQTGHNAGMPKRSSKKKLADPETEQPASNQAGTPAEPAPAGKNPAAVALGRLGGKKGGLARAAKLTKEQRREIAKKAARARWEKARETNQTSSSEGS
jgi:hypothetical protein